MSEPGVRRSTINLPAHFIALALFVVALVPRLPGLGRFLTSDENTNIFFAGSDVIAAFLRGDFAATYWHFYPGVTMSWLDGLGMSSQYLLEWLSGATLPAFTNYIYGDILSLLVANRLPYAFLTAASIPLLYGLGRRLLPDEVALLGALFLAFDPFFLAHSRVAHGDAPLAVFMAISALAFFIYIKQVSESASQRVGLALFGPSLQSSFLYLIVSAICGGLAALTKAPGQFMAIFVVGVSLICAGLEIGKAAGHKVSRPLIFWLTIIALWGLISLLTFVILWPAMWVDPLGTMQRMLSETVGKVEEGHLVYFWGQPTLDPGPWFYLYVIPFRLTPMALLGLFLSLLLVIPQINPKPSSRLTLLFLWGFTLSLLLFGTLSPKKQDRYLLPLFPFLNLLAAVGWIGLFNLAIHFFKPQKTSVFHFLRLPFCFLLLLFHFLPVISYYPYYLTYFNPLMGGPTRAAQTTLMGWGEGMEQVAAYLNAKPKAERLSVASTPAQTLLPYFAGTGENFYTNDIAFRADYVALYLAQMQRLAPSPEIVAYFQARPPEKEIMIQGVTYAKIYPGPKLILTDIPSEATPANIGLGSALRLAGYKIQNSTLTLYWHALAPLPVNYTISVRAHAADGKLLAQRDSWPVNGLLPTTLWRQGDYVSDRYTLEIPPPERAQMDYFEVVVYNAATGAPLNPPITLPLNQK